MTETPTPETLLPRPNWPGPRLALLLAVYRVAWVLAVPVLLAYLWWRGRRDAVYARNIAERFGRHAPVPRTPRVWVHAVSMGEFRAAAPLIDRLLAEGQSVVVTCFTATGRRSAEARLGGPIAEGRVHVTWVPFDMPGALARFLRTFRPDYALMMESECWPGILRAGQRHGVPVFLCNGLYASGPFERDRGRWLSRAPLVAGFAGVMVKAQVHADRFAALGQPRSLVTGELRFDQPVPAPLIAAGQALRETLSQGRAIVTFASTAAAEDAGFIEAIKALTPRPLIVYVPRAPERFDTVHGMLTDAGLTVARRSEFLSPELTLNRPLEPVDVLLGDSLGEMYAYLALADRVVVGGGFTPPGSHNIAEPLLARKPIVLGPLIGPVEYPGTEALAAGIATQTDMDTLAATLTAPDPTPDGAIDTFLAQHGQAVERTMTAIQTLRTAP